MTRLRLGVLVALSWLALIANSEPAQQEGTKENRPQLVDVKSVTTTSEGSEPEKLDLGPVPVFPPQAEGEPITRMGGATRGIGPSIRTLVPTTPGRTTTAHPVLYWYVVKPIPGPVDFKLELHEDGARVVERSLEGPFEPGIQRIRLAEYGVELDPGTVYGWTLSSGASYDSGGIKRVAPSSALTKELAEAGEERVPFVYARHGIWYEALDRLSERVDAEPQNPELRRQRAALLAQVDLDEVARRDLAEVGIGD